MTQLTVNRSTETIAAEINAIKIQTQNMMLHASAEIGKRLTEAKEMVQHGEWGNWLKGNVDYSQSTANNLMQIYKEYDLNSQTFANLSYSKAIALLGVAADEREAFIQENDVENLSTRELQKAIKEKQELEKQLANQASATEKAEKEKAKLEKNIAKLEKQLASAQLVKEAETNDQVESLTIELEEAREKAAQLEQALKEKPLEASMVTVEQVPAEVQAELEQLRGKLSESTDPAEVKFKIRFESLVDEFGSVLEALDELHDEKMKEKYTGAIVKLIDRMRGTLKDDNS